MRYRTARLLLSDFGDTVDLDWKDEVVNMQPVTRETVVELHELCLDICPFSQADRYAVCLECPVYAYAAKKQWRIAFSDALKLIKDWAGFCGKRIA